MSTEPSQAPPPGPQDSSRLPAGALRQHLPKQQRATCVGLGIWDLWLRVWGLGLGVCRANLGRKVWGLEFRVYNGKLVVLWHAWALLICINQIMLLVFQMHAWLQWLEEEQRKDRNNWTKALGASKRVSETLIGIALGDTTGGWW